VYMTIKALNAEGRLPENRAINFVNRQRCTFLRGNMEQVNYINESRRDGAVSNLASYLRWRWSDSRFVCVLYFSLVPKVSTITLY
jgi:hypothetical protein